MTLPTEEELIAVSELSGIDLACYTCKHLQNLPGAGDFLLSYCAARNGYPLWIYYGRGGSDEVCRHWYYSERYYV